MSNVWVRLGVEQMGFVDISKAVALRVEGGKQGVGFWHVNAEFAKDHELTLQSFTSEVEAGKYLEKLMALHPMVVQIKEKQEQN